MSGINTVLIGIVKSLLLPKIHSSHWPVRCAWTPSRSGLHSVPEAYSPREQPSLSTAERGNQGIVGVLGIGIFPQVWVLAMVPFWGSSGWPHRSGQAVVCADAANKETGVGVDRISYSEYLLIGYLSNSSSDEILFEWHKYISCYLIGKWIVYLYF